MSMLFACASDKDTDKVRRSTDAAASGDEMIVKTRPVVPQPPASKPGLPPPSVPLPGDSSQMFAESQKIARNAQLSCRDGDCNPSVGLMSAVIKDAAGWTAGQCTASLIAPDIIVTNGHCIPIDLAKAGSDCRGRLFLTFAAEANHKDYDHQIGCSRVLYRHKDPSFDGSDYAYVQLERASNRPALRQSREGFEHGKKYFINKVNPLRAVDTGKGKGVAGEFAREACSNMQDTAIFDQPLNKQSHSQLLVDCKVIPGNSGSPVLAEDGSLRGVVYAFLKKELLHSLHSQNGSTIPDPADLADLNLVSNFACLKDASDPEGRALPAACAGFSDRLLAAKAATEAKKVEILKPTAQKLIQEKKEDRVYIAAFGWTIRTSQSPQTGTVAVAFPECVNKAPAAPLVGMRSPLFRPLFYVKASYDRYIHASNYALDWGSFSGSEETLEINDVDGSFRTKITDPNSGQSELDQLLGAC